MYVPTYQVIFVKNPIICVFYKTFSTLILPFGNQSNVG